MQKYMFLKQRLFESTEKFEKKLNETVNAGWKVVNFTMTMATLWFYWKGSGNGTV